MQSGVWQALLRRIPQEMHGNLMAKTTAGTEINIQSVLRLEDDFLVLRGRLAGSTDMGKIFFLPYERIDHMGFQKETSEAQVQEIFDGQPTASAPPPPAETSAVAPQPPEPQSPVVAPASAPPSADVPPSLLTRLPTKSKIIERLKLRVASRNSGAEPKE